MIGPGVICVIVRKEDGYVLGWGADFEKSGGAGVSQQDNQARRAREGAKADFVFRQCSELVAIGMDSYGRDRLVERLRESGLIEIQVEPIGYELAANGEGE